VPGMKVGGRRELVIPAALAYGSKGSGSTIPPNAPLVFVIDLLGT
jgi:FKBP-type peptidyl-prolyl cis-trans isomerase FkpA